MFRNIIPSALSKFLKCPWWVTQVPHVPRKSAPSAPNECPKCPKWVPQVPQKQHVSAPSAPDECPKCPKWVPQVPQCPKYVIRWSPILRLELSIRNENRWYTTDTQSCWLSEAFVQKSIIFFDHRDKCSQKLALTTKNYQNYDRVCTYYLYLRRSPPSRWSGLRHIEAPCSDVWDPSTVPYLLLVVLQLPWWC